MDLSAWHARFQQQARWTEQLRKYIWEQIGLSVPDRVLEVGCGTGALLETIPQTKSTHGLDIDFDRLLFAQAVQPNANLICGDGLRLPYAAHSFDHVMCHYYLLWVGKPKQALAEMMRVTKPGGHIVAIAEPDHMARIDAPPALQDLGRLQTQALAAQGANTSMGRELMQLFNQVGLADIESGMLNGPGAEAPSRASWELEWQTRINDLENALSPQEIERLQEQDWQAYQQGDRVLFIPTYYALGRTT